MAISVFFNDTSVLASWFKLVFQTYRFGGLMETLFLHLRFTDRDVQGQVIDLLQMKTQDETESL